MTRSATLPLGKRILAWAFDAATTRMYGRPIPFMREMLRTYSLGQFFQISALSAKTLQKMTERYGICDANILIGYAAMWNGCRFCSRGHVWTANLYYLRSTGKLFPLDDAEIPVLQRLADSEILTRSATLLNEGEKSQLAALIDRQFQLKAGTAAGITDDDPYLRAALASWDWMSECTIVVEEDEAFPPDPIVKDTALLDRYLKLRGRA